jgi:chaperonin GroES
MSAKIRPLSDKIVVKLIDETQQSSGGIFIPDSAREKPQKGEVLAVGPGKVLDSGSREEMEVKVGDIVLFGKFSGSDVKIDNVEYKILSVKELLGVIE